MASGRIKGITIEIGGDTTQLDKSLRTVDKSIRSTQADLRDVNKLLKFDPKNTELLSQKQELLGKAVDETATRLEALKDAQAQMDASGVDKNSDQYKGLQREIIATEQNLKRLKDEQKDFGNVASQVLKQAGKEVSDYGAKIKGVGDSMTKSVTAPIVAIGTASLAAWGQVDEGLDIVVQKTGATGDALAGMQDSVKNIANTIPTSFAAAGEAVGEVNTRFGLTGDALEDLSTQFIKFSEINGTGLTASVDAAQKALAAFGLGAEDAGAYLDTLTKVGQNTGISVDTLSSGLTKNATAFQEMGLSIDQAAVLMGQIEMSGADTNAVLGGLSKALKNASKDGVSMDKALADLEDSIKNGKSDTEGLAAAYELFGKSGDQVFNALKSGSLSFQALGENALEAGGAVEDTFAAMQDPADQWQVVLNNLMELGYEIGEAIMPAIQKAVDAVIPVIQTLVGWWESLDEDTQSFIVTAALVVAAIGPVISIIGTVTGAIGGVIGAIGSIVGVLGGPLTLAIGAAIALGIALWKNWDTVKAKAEEVFAAVKEKWDGIKKAISDAIEGAKKAVSSGIEKIKGLFNFEFKWPKLKLPHFTVQGSLNPLTWFESGMPKIGVEWYRKAAQTPYLFTQPSIIGVGDVPEIVIGADAFRRMQSSGPTINAPITIVQQPGQDARALSRAVINELRLTLNAEGRGLK